MKKDYVHIATFIKPVVHDTSQPVCHVAACLVLCSDCFNWKWSDTTACVSLNTQHQVSGRQSLSFRT